MTFTQDVERPLPHRRDAVWGLFCALGAGVHVTGWLEPREMDIWGPTWVLEECQKRGLPVNGVCAGRVVTTRYGRRLHLDWAATAAAINAALAPHPPRSAGDIARQLADQGVLRTGRDGGRTRYAVLVGDAAGRQTRAWDISLPALLEVATTQDGPLLAEPAPPPPLRPRTGYGERRATCPATDPLSGAPECTGGWTRSRRRWRRQRDRHYTADDPMVWEFDFTVWPELPRREHPIVEVRRALADVSAPQPVPWDWPEDPAVQLRWYVAAVHAWTAALDRQSELAEGIIASLCELHRYGFRWRAIDLHLAPVTRAERDMAAAGRFQPARLAAWVRREGDRWDNPIARYGWLARLSTPEDLLEKAAAREIYLLADGLHRAGFSVEALVDAGAHQGPTATMIRRAWREWDNSTPRGPGSEADYVRSVLRADAGLPPDPRLRTL